MVNMKKNNFLKSFKVNDLVIIAMFVAITLAFKTIAGILIRMITGPLGIPGGALAGGLYMLWLPLGIAVVGKRGVAFLIAAVQTVVLLITGLSGSHGIWTILTYLTPAILVEIVFLFQRNNQINILHFLFAVMLANIAGTYGSNLLFFRMSFWPLIFTLSAAALSGSLGGVIGYMAYEKLKKTSLLKSRDSSEEKSE